MWYVSPPVTPRDDKKRLKLTGQATYTCRLPGMICPLCGPGAGTRVLAVKCPSPLREQLEKLKQSRPCIPLEDFNRHRIEWELELVPQIQGLKLKPGDRFPPCAWKISSPIPDFDIFWPFNAIIVTQRIADAFQKCEISGVEFYPIKIEELRSDSSEPCREKHFVQMSIVNHSYDLYASGGHSQTDICPECGRITEKSFNRYHAEREMWAKKQCIPKKYTFSSDVFYSHIYFNGGLIMSCRAYDLFSLVANNNYCATQIKVVD